ncbi:MAG: acetyl-CoA carboxylase biotin carboxylase subunit [Ignavibacteriales bacterium]|nr:acetyl-CoA carboxylase biotin carboxylase subunit [Ignavibacteriales bacterium]
MKTRPLRKILVANRGEIAVRIIRACRDLGIQSIAVYSDPDRTALHVQLADEAYPLKGTRASETYLDQSKILTVAAQATVDALHPGYGFLSENQFFSAAVEQAGVRFIGPPAKAIRLLGDKTSARTLARKLGLPTISGTEALADGGRALAAAKDLGFPVLLKAAAGGGGKGMRVVQSESKFASLFEMAQSEVQNAFGDDRIFIEQYIKRPHHVEIQVLADEHGNVVHLGERDCSIQRRHQKVVEESPSPLITPELRNAMGEAAVRLIRAAGYVNAGTVEFLVDASSRYYFLEVNTRLQVEHPVTEAVTGFDLVKEQIHVAGGDALSFTQKQIRFNGHAIECRIYAEDPLNNFLPSTGRLAHFIPPDGPCVRVDSGALAGDLIGIHYDPMLAKVICWGGDRPQAIATMRRALREFVITGVETTLPFCQAVLKSQAFVDGNHNTQFIDKEFDFNTLREIEGEEHFFAALAAILIKRSLAERPQETQDTVGQSLWRLKREDTYR